MNEQKTLTDFHALCGEHLIDPSIAMEDEQIIDCLMSMKDAGCDNAYNGYYNCLSRLFETNF